MRVLVAVGALVPLLLFALAAADERVHLRARERLHEAPVGSAHVGRLPGRHGPQGAGRRLRPVGGRGRGRGANRTRRAHRRLVGPANVVLGGRLQSAQRFSGGGRPDTEN